MESQVKLACGAPPRILIVDDSSVATKVIGNLLKRRGCSFCAQNDPTKAQQRARKFRPDLILLDVRMPYKDGYDLVADFARDEELQHVPVVMMTANSQQEEIPHPLPILFKPFSIEDLIATIEKGLGKRLGENAEFGAKAM